MCSQVRKYGIKKYFCIFYAIFLFAEASAEPALHKPINKHVNLDESDTLAIPLNPAGVEALSQGEVLAVLGDYDVSSLLSYENGTLFIHHNGALDAGRYTLRVTVENENSHRVLAQQNLLFYRSNWRTDTQFTNSSSYELNSEQNDGFSENIRRLNELALRSQAQLQSKHFGILTRLDIQHRSDANTLSGEKLEIPNFLVNVEKSMRFGDLGLALGNQLIEKNNLVFNGFNRRGVSTSITGADNRYSLSTFYINTDPEVSANDNVLIASDKEERSNGALAEFSVLKSHPEKLRVSAGYIDGQSVLNGIGLSYADGFLEGEDQTSYGGQSWFVSVESLLFNHALNLELERAGSNIDIDGFGVGEQKQSDKAHKYALQLNSQGVFQNTLSFTGLQQWNITAQRQKVGANFYSMANIGLAGDLETTQTAFNGAWSQIQLTLSLLDVSNNVDDSEDRATQRTKQSQVYVSYSPQINNEDSLWLLVGQPQFSFQYGLTNRDQDIDDALLVGYDINDETQDYQLSASFQKGSVSWGLQYGDTQFTNDAALETPDGFLLFSTSPSTKNRFVSVNLQYSPSARFSISPTLQRSHYQEQNSPNDQVDLNFGLQANTSFLNDRLQVYVNHNLAKQESRFGEAPQQRYQSEQSSLAVNWLAKEAKQQNAGIKLSLSGTWNQQTSSFFDSQDGYQILIGFEMYWAGGSQR